MKKINNLVAGIWEECDDYFTSLERKFSIANLEQAKQSVVAAHKAFLCYGNSSNKERAEFLSQIQRELEKQKSEILTVYQEESKLPEGRAEGEFARTLTQIQSFVDLLLEGQYVQAKLQQIEGGAKIRKMLQPIGPIAVFGASNFPLAFSTAGGDTISALAAGCPVIVKAHPYHPMTSYLVATAIDAAVKACDLPKGVFSHLQSDQHLLGQALVEHPQLCGVGFTGSYKGGKALYDLAQQRPVPIPVFAEMGSINPMILFPGALSREDLTTKLGDSICLGSGQFCTNPGVIIALGDTQRLDEFEKNLGDYLIQKAPQEMVHENIANQYEAKLNVLEDKIKLFKGEQAALGVSTAKNFLQHKMLREEVFGPYSLLVRCSSLDEVEAIIMTIEGQLTLSLIGTTTDHAALNKILPLAQQKAGRILFEGVPTGVAVTQAMMHGGPFPASTDERFSAVGIDAIYRWLRPVSYQDCPEALLPPALKQDNPLGITRNINGLMTKDSV